MFKIIKTLVKITYILSAILIVLRMFLKFNGVKAAYSDHKFYVEIVYNITDILLTPMTFIIDKIKPLLPESILNFFPIIVIKQPYFILEWSCIITFILCFIVGIMIENFINILISYEEAFISIGKDAKKGKTKLARLKPEADMQETVKTRESSLKDAYNLIIKRLDREKTELVNKNISLEKELITDTLTGLKTRKYMDDRLKYEFNNSKVRKNDLSVIMFDIDHFKNINDKFGHQVGDMVLQDVSKIIINSCCVNSFAARYGGEEIIIICPRINSKSAHDLAESIRCSIENNLKDKTSDERSITISAGIATYNGNETIKSPADLIKKADIALYQAKNNGRNKVVIYNG